MTAIDERHVQVATVDRMRQMLHSTRRDFEITQTYTLFTGILCWVMQRVRWQGDNTELRDAMTTLRLSLEQETFRDFVKPIARPLLQEVGKASKALDGRAFNDFSELLATARADMSSLDALVHLRNAVAHGDHRRVIPLNKDQQLLGYRIECVMGSWSAALCLDRKGMTFIGNELANRFCVAALHSIDIGDAQAIRENRP